MNVSLALTPQGQVLIIKIYLITTVIFGSQKQKVHR